MRWKYKRLLQFNILERKSHLLVGRIMAVFFVY
uniref:ABC transporter permease n=1 Tax=Heterorhabditis bacteriophora TaxID=37862 RepID=A0A1I7XLU2_HETBA